MVEQAGGTDDGGARPGAPFPVHPPSGMVGSPQQRPQTLNIVLTVGGLVVLAIAAVAAWFAVTFGIMATDACYGDCDWDRIDAGFAVGQAGAVIVFTLATVAAVVLLAARRTAWWVPLVGVVLEVILVVVAWEIIGSGV